MPGSPSGEGPGSPRLLRRRSLAGGLLLAVFLGGCGIQGNPIPPENVPPETPPEAPQKKSSPGGTPSAPQKGGGDLNQEEPEGGFPDQ
ncbi:MAG: hypothetical protein ACP5OP_05155 [Leptospirillia bacterium]